MPSVCHHHLSFILFLRLVGPSCCLRNDLRSLQDSGRHLGDDHGHHCDFNAMDPFRCLETAEEKKGMRHHMMLRSMAAVCIAGLLMLLTYVFEYGVHGVHHLLARYKPHLSHLWSHLLQELTILGFIATILWLTSQTDLFDRLNELLLGKPPEKYDLKRHATHDFREGHVLNEFVVLVEEFHFLIFKVMILYLFLTLVIAFYLEKKVREWRVYENLPPRVLLTSEGDLGLDSSKPTMDYHLLRLEFIRPLKLSSTGVQCGHDRMKASVLGEELPEWFPFNEYMTRVTTKHIADLVSVPPAGLVGTLLCVPVLSLGAFTESSTTDEMALEYGIYMFALCVCVGVAVVAVRTITAHLEDVLDEMRAPKSSAKYRFHLPWDSLEAVDTSFKDVPPEDLLARYRLKEPSCVPPVENPSAWTKFWYGTPQPTQHEQLFIRWRRGPRFLLRSLQLLNLTCCVILSLNVQFVVFGWATGHVRRHFLWYLPLLCWLAGLYFLSLLRVVIMYMFATSVGDMIDHGAVLEVQTNSERTHLGHLLSIMLVATASGFTNGSDKQMTLSQLREVSAQHSLQKKNIHAAVFRSYAPHGTLQREAAPAALRDLGLHCPSDSLEGWFKLFDVDCNGTLDAQEFELLVAGHELLAKKGLDEEKCSEALHQADANSDGYLSRDELAEVLKKLGIHQPMEAATILISAIRDAEVDGDSADPAPFGMATVQEVVKYLAEKTDGHVDVHRSAHCH